MTDALQYLDTLEANNRAILYECRWKSQTAAPVVRELKNCLQQSDRSVLIRTLRALYCIGLPAEAATPEVIPLLLHQDTIVARMATMTAAAVGRNNASLVVPALISASLQPVLLKEAMFALIVFKSEARDGTRVFTTALSNADHHVRRLAIRGLEAVADDAALHHALEQALNDRSKAVREYAQKVRKRTTPEAAGSAGLKPQ